MYSGSGDSGFFFFFPLLIPFWVLQDKISRKSVLNGRPCEYKYKKDIISSLKELSLMEETQMEVDGYEMAPKACEKVMPEGLWEHRDCKPNLKVQVGGYQVTFKEDFLEEVMLS